MYKKTIINEINDKKMGFYTPDRTKNSLKSMSYEN